MIPTWQARAQEKLPAGLARLLSAPDPECGRARPSDKPDTPGISPRLQKIIDYCNPRVIKTYILAGGALELAEPVLRREIFEYMCTWGCWDPRDIIWLTARGLALSRDVLPDIPGAAEGLREAVTTIIMILYFLAGTKINAEMKISGAAVFDHSPAKNRGINRYGSKDSRIHPPGFAICEPRWKPGARISIYDKDINQALASIWKLAHQPIVQLPGPSDY